MRYPYSKQFTSRANLAKSKAPQERSPFTTGVDMIVENGDIALTPAGDIAVTSGAEAIILGFLRRLGTPPFGYKRQLLTAQGIIQLNPDYLDGLYDYLSAPLSTSNAKEMLAALQQCARLDGRVEIIDVSQQPMTQPSNSISLSITYRIKSSTQLQSLNLTVGSIN